jgi:preprotein translocase subunit SecY
MKQYFNWLRSDTMHFVALLAILLLLFSFFYLALVFKYSD